MTCCLQQHCFSKQINARSWKCFQFAQIALSQRKTEKHSFWELHTCAFQLSLLVKANTCSGNSLGVFDDSFVSLLFKLFSDGEL